MTEFRRQIKDPEKESRIFLFRGRLLLFFVVLLMFVLLGRMAYLQVFQYDIYTLRSERNRTSVEAIPPTRGLIYDRQGKLLADNLPSHSLTLTRELTEDVKLVVARIDRKSTRLNSSHVRISYAVFCLKKKNKIKKI